MNSEFCFARFASEYVEELRQIFTETTYADLEACVNLLASAFEEGKTVFLVGNGGSAATASHMACDLQKTTLGKSHDSVRKRVRAIALTDNVPLVTAWSNDVHYDRIFSEQLRNLGESGDVLVVISASGNSPNILSILDAAAELGIRTVGFLGFSGGAAANKCDLKVVVSSENYGLIEDVHSIFMHIATASLRRAVLAGAGPIR